MHDVVPLLACFVLFYSAIAGRIDKSALSGPILFVAFGLVIGPLGFGILTLEDDAEPIKVLAELTLALVLFTDASGVDIKQLRRGERLARRLLLVGLPLTILLGFGLGVAVFAGVTVFEVAILATMLAPTDAALGKAVVSNEAVPKLIRQSLNVESGLNDGICVPILYLFLAFALGEVGQGGGLGMGMGLFAKSVGVGLVVGGGLTAVGVALLRAGHQRGWLTHTWSKVSVIALAFACFGVSEALHGSGFIASFVGGLVFGAAVGKEARKKLLGAAEGIGDTFALLTWVVFGAAVVGQDIVYLSWPILLYAVLSLTVIRMLPSFIALAGTKQSTEAKLFMGWFGPRGLASIVFAVMVLEAGLPNGDLLVTTVVYTVVLSIIAHGVTANPWARAFGERARRALGRGPFEADEVAVADTGARERHA